VAEQSATTKADAQGKWRVTLKPIAPTEKTTLVVSSGTATVTVANVLVGEVWFASGQSNMGRRQNNDDKDLKVTTTIPSDPLLRLFVAREQRLSEEPLDDLKPSVAGVGGWMLADAKSVGDFSAVGYYFGRDLRAATKRPVGVIVAAVGGAPAQNFVSGKVLNADPELRPLIDSKEKRERLAKLQEETDKLAQQWEAAAEQAKREGKPPPAKPEAPTLKLNPIRSTITYNGQIAPIIPYAIKGVIWYQGESNSATEYTRLFSSLITSWRSEWGQGDFPFLFVQITYQSARFREVQQQVAQSLPNLAMVTIQDLGMRGDPAHPPGKEPVGSRLALAARALAYGEAIEYSGPVYASARFEDRRAIVSFTHLGGGLAAREGGLKGFQLAGEDQQFAIAQAEIVGDTVVVTCDQIATPVAVRYGFLPGRRTVEDVTAHGGRSDSFAPSRYCPAPSLINKAGLLAPPFRSDAWTVR
jgi:sialate O-acetylesterase